MNAKINVKNNRLTKYIKDSYEEMRKVAWPTRQETIRLTIVVILISVFVATFLGLLDYIFSFGVQQIITNFR